MNRRTFSRRDALGRLSSAALVGAAGPSVGYAPAAVSHGSTLVVTNKRIERDMVVDGDLVFAASGSIEVADGVTVTVIGDVVASARRIFRGGGRIDLLRSRVVAARPEWWGARADDPAVDCLPAFDACLAAHLAMQLGLGDYHVADTWKIALNNRRIWGIGRFKEARGTRIVRRGGVGAAVLVGTDTVPSEINAFVQGIDMRWLQIGRTASAVAPPADDADAPAGLAIRHVLDCRFEGIGAQEHAIGFSMRGAVRTYLEDCSAFRSSASDGAAGRDIFVGFDLGGLPRAGTTGANASLYLTDCNARIGGTFRLAKAIGLRIDGAFADTVITRLETTSLEYGIVVDGRTAMLGGRARAGHVDLHIQSAVLDQCRIAGISIADLGEEALVDICDPYVAIAPGGGHAIRLDRARGNLSIVGGQLIGWVDGTGSGIGLGISGSRGVDVSSLKVTGFARPAVLTATSIFDLGLAVTQVGRTLSGPAVALAGCREGVIRCTIKGDRGAFACGVAASEGSDTLTVEAAGMDPASLRGGRVLLDGQEVRPFQPGRVLVVAPFSHGGSPLVPGA